MKAVLPLVGIFCLPALLSCYSLPLADKSHRIALFSRGIDYRKIGTLTLRYSYEGPGSSNNYFTAQLSSIAYPLEQIQIPRSKSVHPWEDARSPRYNPHTGYSYTKIQTVIPEEASFQGVLIFPYQTRQPYRHKDRRLIKRLLLISQPDSLDSILTLDFYLYPGRNGYMLRVDLRPAQDFYRLIPPGTPANEAADRLGDTEENAIFHNQTIVGKNTYF
ncbi:MAG: hypothetical protein AAF975_00190 [Spirochaetota bacterium]